MLPMNCAAVGAVFGFDVNGKPIGAALSPAPTSEFKGSELMKHCISEIVSGSWFHQL